MTSDQSRKDKAWFSENMERSNASLKSNYKEQIYNFCSVKKILIKVFLNSYNNKTLS